MHVEHVALPITIHSPFSGIQSKRDFAIYVRVVRQANPNVEMSCATVPACHFRFWPIITASGEMPPMSGGSSDGQKIVVPFLFQFRNGRNKRLKAGQF
jgi:hypothetical protein